MSKKNVFIAGFICLVLLLLVGVAISTEVIPSASQKTNNPTAEKIIDDESDQANQKMEGIQIPFKIKPYETTPVEWGKKHIK